MRIIDRRHGLRGGGCSNGSSRRWAWRASSRGGLPRSLEQRLELQTPEGILVLRPEELSGIERLGDGLVLHGVTGWHRRIETGTVRDGARVLDTIAAPEVLCSMLPRCDFRVDVQPGARWAA